MNNKQNTLQSISSVDHTHCAEAGQHRREPLLLLRLLLLILLLLLLLSHPSSTSFVYSLRRQVGVAPSAAAAAAAARYVHDHRRQGTLRLLLSVVDVVKVLTAVLG